jgi:hypothetical protein
MPAIRLAIEINALAELAQKMKDMVPTDHPTGQDFTALFKYVYFELQAKHEQFQKLDRSSPDVKALWEEIRKAIEGRLPEESES